MNTFYAQTPFPQPKPKTHFLSYLEIKTVVEILEIMDTETKLQQTRQKKHGPNNQLKCLI